MRKYCNEIENGKSVSSVKYLQDHLARIKEWYITQHRDINQMLKVETLSALAENIKEQTRTIDSLSDNFNAKLSLFSVIEWTIKHLLSCFSSGPISSNGTCMPGTKSGIDWFSVKYDFVSLVEILQSELQKNNVGYEINLYSLLEDRDVRNGFTHSGKTDICISAIRCYNILRDMIIFMDAESISSLPVFEYPRLADYSINDFFAHTTNLDFKNSTTILISGALHDLQQNHKDFFARLPWDFVIDFDGCSHFGGLLSSAQQTNINARLFTSTVSNSLGFAKGFTNWLRCGEFVDYSLAQNKNGKNLPIIDTLSYKKPFYENIKFFNKQQYLQQLLEKVIATCETAHNPITIVYLLGDEEIAQIVLRLCEQKLTNVTYSFTGVFYASNDAVTNIETTIFNGYRQYGESYEKQFKFIQTDLNTFFEDLYQYKDQFALQTTPLNQKELPSNSGFSQVSVNTYTNLYQYFEVLYKGIEQEEACDIRKDIADFYKGNKASWMTYASGRVIETILTTEYTRHIDKIKSNLGRIQPNGKDKIFVLEHIAGIGGSTLLRKISWDLHEQYPVLLIKKYDKYKIKDLITDLYDSQKRGILVVADSELSEIEDLIHDIRVIDRPCVLLYSTRQSQNSINGENKISLSKITSNAEHQLKLAFKDFSPLNSEEVIAKDKQYDLFIKQDNSMRTPFMIGLYYMDKEFKGVKNYIEQISKEVGEIIKIKAFAFICLADVYGQTSIPATLINNYLCINPRVNILDGMPHSKGIFIRTSNNGTIYYKSKHVILSENMLEFCCNRIYHSSLGESLSTLANDFVDFMIDICSNSFNDDYKDLLERIFTSRNASVYGIASFSKLIEDILTPEARIDVLKKISEKFLKIAEQKTEEENSKLYMMVAHFWGHLGRLCSKKEIGIVNNEKALEYTSKAVELMDKCGQVDPVVLHMNAEARLNALQSECQFLLDANAQSVDVNFTRYEDKISEIESIFSKVASLGSVDYAYISIMSMYLDYLAFVYKIKSISSLNDFTRLSTYQRNLQVAINEIIEILYDVDEMSEKSYLIYSRLVNRYRSDIMMGDFGSAINYYDNRLQELSQKNPNAVIEIMNVRSGLISSIIGKYKTNSVKNVFKDMKQSDIERILILLDETLAQGFDIAKYHDRQKRMMSCRLWLRAAKYSKRTIEQGIIVAQKWADCESKHMQKDPLPYYYLYVLYYLSVLEGSTSHIHEVANHQRRSYEVARLHGKSTNNLRDILLDGTGMGRLSEVSAIETTISDIQDRTICPTKISGRFERIEAKKGYVTIQTPIAFSKQIAKFNLGSVNTLSEQQLSHEVEFYCGFSFEQLSAIDLFVKDISSGESLNGEQLHTKSQPQKVNISVENHVIVNSHNNCSVGDIIKFLPKYIRYTSSDIIYLNGTTDFRVKAKVASTDLLKYSSHYIESIGGINELLKLMIKNNRYIEAEVVKKGYSGELSLSIFNVGIELEGILKVENNNCKSITELNQAKGDVSKTSIDNLIGQQVSFLAEKKNGVGLIGKFYYEDVQFNGIIRGLDKSLVGKSFLAKIISANNKDSIFLQKL